jgi:hypothetical protein
MDIENGKNEHPTETGIISQPWILDLQRGCMFIVLSLSKDWDRAGQRNT